MRDLNQPNRFHWTVPLGRWGQTSIRLHFFFVLAVVSSLYLSWLAGQRDAVESALGLSMLAIVILTLSVALHIAGHIYASTQLHIPFRDITIGPHGDFAQSVTTIDPRSQIIVSLAGPAVNLLIALACLPGVLALGEQTLLGLLNPFSPDDLLARSGWVCMLKLTMWMNWSIAILNLLPAHPFDGGPAAHAIAQMLYPRASRRRIELAMVRVGVFTGFGLLIAAALYRDAVGVLVPAWLPLVVLGVVVLFSSQRSSVPQSRRPADDELFGYDFSQGYTSLEKSHARIDDAEDENGPLERWLETRREQRRERQEELEAEEDALVDEILARVHANGIDGLTPEERMLLDRVSIRYRTRMDET